MSEKTSSKIGLPPGAMIHIGEKKTERILLNVIDYEAERISSSELGKIEDALPFKDSDSVTWLNVIGLHDVEMLQTLGQHFGIHALVLEDILNTQQRPKVEFYDDHIFVVFKMIHHTPGQSGITLEQVSLILGPKYVITFQEQSGDIFDPIRQRLQNIRGRLRKHGTDYLMYALLDVVLDNYYLVLETYSDAIENLEEEALAHPRASLIQDIQQIRKEIIMLRRSLWPMREAFNDLINEDSELITDYTIPYLKDLSDHTISVIDSIEVYREMTASIMDIYLSTMSHRMNEVMKVLTIIATIFIPLTFVAGIYGMNFEYMPELKWPLAYPVFWLVIIAISSILIIFFRRKKWL